MDAKTEALIPAEKLAREDPIRIPGESAEYRAARRRCWPRRSNCAVTSSASPRSAGRCRRGRGDGDYRSRPKTAQRPRRPVRRQGDPGDLQLHVRPSARAAVPDVHQSAGRLGGQRRRHRPEGVAGGGGALADRAAVSWKAARGWKNLRLASDLKGKYFTDWFGLTPDGQEVPAQNVFTRRDGTLRHFWSAEITTSDPGQDPRGARTPPPLGRARPDAGRTRSGLVPEPQLRRLTRNHPDACLDLAATPGL